MSQSGVFQFGIDRISDYQALLLASRRVGLLAHPASITSTGLHASVHLRNLLGSSLTALFGPEHGYFGFGSAGEDIASSLHADWNIPIYSLYGEYRRPTTEMLTPIDVMIFDLQDIGVRCYTFVSTLRFVLEECARCGVKVIVCDRPVPQSDVIDGPELDPRFESFVGAVPLPLVYGMTPGEAALYINKFCGIGADLDVISMTGYKRQSRRGPDWPPWISPSPGIRYWETCWYYPSTVFFEAIPAIDYGRSGLEPFQIISAPFINAEKLAGHLNEQGLPGISFSPHWGRYPGVRLHCTDPRKYLPVTTGFRLIRALQDLFGADRIWDYPGTRPEFFDKLAGCDSARIAIRGSAGDFEAFLRVGPAQKFRSDRQQVLLYS